MRLKKRAVTALVAAIALPAAQFYAANAATASTPAAASSRPGPTSPAQTQTQTQGSARLADPAGMLPNGWQKSSDEALTVVGDGTGLHVLAASEASGYAWKSVATLGDPTVQTDLWIGQGCMADSGKDAVVVYAPEQVANTGGEQGEMGRAAVVDLRTGAVKYLGGGFSVAYFDPGCGTGDTAVLTEDGWANDSGSAPASTTLAVVNTSAGAITSTVRVPGQVTSAIPYQGQIAAATGSGLEEIGATGAARLLAATSTVPYQLAPDADAGLGYQTLAGDKVDMWHLASGRTHLVASIPEGSADLRQSDGRVWLIGPDASSVHGLPAQWKAMDAPVTAQPSTTGTLVVTNAGALKPAKGESLDPAVPAPVGVNVQLLGGSRASASLEVATTAAAATPSSSSPSGVAQGKSSVRATAATSGSPTTPVSADRTCGVAIDDPQIQAYQPTFQQVEWAADQAVQGTLTDTRPAGLYGSSLPAYTPQALFPLPAVDGGGSLPAQVLLGVLTQESNLQQASTHVVQGQTSNPLASFNWYGNWIDNDSENTGLINWQASDCGYGIGQITSGMCLTRDQNKDPECEYSAPLPAEDQLAIAVDYQANIAAAAQLLINIWNQLYSAGIVPNNFSSTTDAGTGNPDYIDDWYQALWAYNSGVEPGTSALGNTTGCTPGPSCTDGNGDWGLGYANNPINPAYPPDRPTFGTSSANNYPGPDGATYSSSWDLSHPEYWPYQDKVLAFAFDSVVLYDYSQGAWVQAFAFAHGSYNSPPPDLFCTSADDCDASGVNFTEATGPDACQLTGSYADHCWWNGQTADTWPILMPTVTCSACGLSVLTYAAGAAAPAAEPIAAQFAQTCASTLPSNAVIVGDGGQSALGCPGQNWTSAGSFSWSFAPDVNGDYSSKILFDQIGAGFGGHFWFGYTVPNDGASATSSNPDTGFENQVITGTWTPPSTATGWTDVKVAIPGYGTDAVDASYQVDPGGGQPGRNVQVNQEVTTGGNTWADLGDFYLKSGAHVTLSNVAPIDLGLNAGVNIAWDAAAFIPVSTPQVNYVAMGDSYSSGEGLGGYIDNTDTATDQCHRSDLAYPMQVELPDTDTPISELSSDAFSFVACSGAETTGVSLQAVNSADTSSYYNAVNPQENSEVNGVPPWNSSGYTDWGTEQNAPDGPVEGLQDDSDTLSSGTQLVTINIGGNDIRFADVIIGCLSAAFVLTGVDDCSANDYVLTRNSNNATDPAPLYEFEPQVIQALTAHLVQTYLAINSVAPNATIIVAGYPQIYPSNPTSSCDSGSNQGKLAMLTPSAQNMLNGFSTDVDNSISSAVAQVQGDGVAIHFVNPTSAFSGHELCSSSPWFQPVSVFNQAGSFHPTATGATAYATLINECLAGTLDC